MIKWLQGTKTVRFRSLKLPLGYDLVTRMNQPHVKALAASMQECGGSPGNLPWVEWGTKELCAGGDRLAAMAINGLRTDPGVVDDLDGIIEVRAFEGTEEDIRRLRRHENIHRRQDRDRWLREQVEEESREIAMSERRGGESAAEHAAVPNDPPEANGGDAHQEELSAPETGIAHEAGSPGPVAPASPAVKAVARKRVAERLGTTPAALKQAEHRDKKRRGESKPARQKHDDSGPSLSPEQLEVQRALIDVDALLSQAVVRLRNFSSNRPDAVRAFHIKERFNELVAVRDAIKADRKVAGL